jgi:hypothetical protein
MALDDSGKALVRARRVGEGSSDSTPLATAAGFVWDHGKMVRIQVPGTNFVNLTAIDPSGAVVGNYHTVSAEGQAAWQGFWWNQHGAHLLKTDSPPESRLVIKVGIGVSARGALAATIAPASDPLLEAHAVVLQP